MQLNLEITSELEARIRQEAELAGMEPSSFIVSTLENHIHQNDFQHGDLAHANGDSPSLSEEESKLLGTINTGLSSEDWDRYRQLIDLRRQENITAEGLAELTAMADRIERLNAQRVTHLCELAQLRGISLPALQDQLGIASPGII